MAESDTGNTIRYRGFSYRRQPGRAYYAASGWAIAKHGRSSLHRDVYRDHHGTIPDGWHVHHIDGDTENNDPANLEAISPSDHARHHYAERAERMAERRAEWMATPEGREVRRRAAAKMRANTPARETTCAHCGAAITTRAGKGRLYCNDDCEYQARRQKNLRPCPICGSAFGGQVNGKRAARTCSYACGWELRRRNRVRADR